ncbi:MAG TPA: acyltransferase family protein [Elusimicrobiota bacterium]|nr:acyltransferase family protein [Elusimicrobiota bacterium]
MNLPIVALPAARSRVFYIDATRTVACLLVVFSHVFAPVCTGLNDYPRSIWWVFNVLDSLIRPCAALYIMISGKIFLGSSRDESYAQFVWKRYARLALPFFVWSMIYAFYEAHLNGDRLAAGPAVRQFLGGPTEYHLWFMYVILGLYLVMPALRRFVRSATTGDLWGFLAVWMGFLVLNLAKPNMAGVGWATTLLSYGGYVVLGYALDRSNLQRRAGAWIFVWAAAIAVNAFGTYFLTIRRAGQLDDRLYFGAAPLVAVQGAAMFLLLKRADEGSIFFRVGWLRSLIKTISRQSYNVYLNHVMFIWIFTKGVLPFVLSENTGSTPLVGVPVTTAAVVACALSVSLFMQKIPMLGKLLVIVVPPERRPEPVRCAYRESDQSSILSGASFPAGEGA